MKGRITRVRVLFVYVCAHVFARDLRPIQYNYARFLCTIVAPLENNQRTSILDNGRVNKNQTLRAPHSMFNPFAVY